MRHFTSLITAFTLLTSIASTRAERAPEQKEKADYIITGRVNHVFTRKEGRLTEYVVQMFIREVHKGEGLKKDEILYAYCFMKSAPLLPVAEPRGHDAVPKEGQLIKAYIHKRGGKHEGNYKDWFEVVEEKAEEKKE